VVTAVEAFSVLPSSVEAAVVAAAVLAVDAVLVAAVLVPDAVVFTDGELLLATSVVEVPELEDASRPGSLPFASWMPM